MADDDPGRGAALTEAGLQADVANNSRQATSDYCRLCSELCPRFVPLTLPCQRELGASWAEQAEGRTRNS